LHLPRLPAHDEQNVSEKKVVSVGSLAKYVVDLEKAVHWQNLQFGGEPA